MCLIILEIKTPGHGVISATGGTSNFLSQATIYQTDGNSEISTNAACLPAVGGNIKKPVVEKGNQLGATQPSVSCIMNTTIKIDSMTNSILFIQGSVQKIGQPTAGE